MEAVPFSEISESERQEPAIYSAQALLGFSTLLNPFIGGVLAYNSLRAAGQLSAAWHVLGTSGWFTLFTLLISQHVAYGACFRIGLGYVWGRWLSQYIQRKVPNAASYPHKSVAKPVLICLVLSVLYVMWRVWARYN